MHDDDRVAEILERWYADREAGSEAEPTTLIRAHPEHADALRAHFEVVDLVDRAFEAPAATPDRIGPYRIVAELGSGGMGKVYLAEDGAGARFALKLVHPHLLESPGFFKRFLREAEVGKAVRHQNVVRTLDVDALVVAGTHHIPS